MQRFLLFWQGFFFFYFFPFFVCVCVYVEFLLFLINMFGLQKLPYLCSTIILLSRKQGVFAKNEVH